jgi:hypothetical protein
MCRIFIAALYIPTPHLKPVTLTGAWINKSWYIHKNEILFSNKKEQTIDVCKNIDESQKYYAE